jgi:hypothetical protein
MKTWYPHFVGKDFLVFFNYDLSSYTLHSPDVPKPIPFQVDVLAGLWFFFTCDMCAKNILTATGSIKELFPILNGKYYCLKCPGGV